MEIKAVLFDMDGVLIDTEELINIAAIEGLKQYGVYAKYEDFIPFIGAGENKYIGGVAEKYGVPFQPEMKAVVYDIYADILKQHPDAVYPGVPEMLKAVKSKYKAAVCSAADFPKVCHNLNAIGITADFFDGVVSGNDVTRHKPFPDVFLKGAEACGEKAENCIAIDDSLNGIKAAKAAGCVSIGITTGFDEETIRKECDPDYIISDIRDLPALIEKIEKK